MYTQWTVRNYLLLHIGYKLAKAGSWGLQNSVPILKSWVSMPPLQRHPVSVRLCSKTNYPKCGLKIMIRYFSWFCSLMREFCWSTEFSWRVRGFKMASFMPPGWCWLVAKLLGSSTRDFGPSSRSDRASAQQAWGLRNLRVL